MPPRKSFFVFFYFIIFAVKRYFAASFDSTNCTLSLRFDAKNPPQEVLDMALRYNRAAAEQTAVILQRIGPLREAPRDTKLLYTDFKYYEAYHEFVFHNDQSALNTYITWLTQRNPFSLKPQSLALHQNVSKIICTLQGYQGSAYRSAYLNFAFIDRREILANYFPDSNALVSYFSQFYGVVFLVYVEDGVRFPIARLPISYVHLRERYTLDLIGIQNVGESASLDYVAIYGERKLCTDWKAAHPNQSLVENFISTTARPVFRLNSDEDTVFKLLYSFLHGFHRYSNRQAILQQNINRLQNRNECPMVTELRQMLQDQQLIPLRSYDEELAHGTQKAEWLLPVAMILHILHQCYQSRINHGTVMEATATILGFQNFHVFDLNTCFPAQNVQNDDQNRVLQCIQTNYEEDAVFSENAVLFIAKASDLSFTFPSAITLGSDGCVFDRKEEFLEQNFHNTYAAYNRRSDIASETDDEMPEDDVANINSSSENIEVRHVRPIALPPRPEAKVDRKDISATTKNATREQPDNSSSSDIDAEEKTGPENTYIRVNQSAMLGRKTAEKLDLTFWICFFLLIILMLIVTVAFVYYLNYSKRKMKIDENPDDGSQ